jgi:hypothetical protein
MFQDWQAHPISQLHKDLLEVWAERLKEQWAAGQFQHEDTYQTALANAQALGQVRLLQQLMELDHDSFEETFADPDDQQLRTSPAGPSSSS